MPTRRGLARREGRSNSPAGPQPPARGHPRAQLAGRHPKAAIVAPAREQLLSLQRHLSVASLLWRCHLIPGNERPRAKNACRRSWFFAAMRFSYCAEDCSVLPFGRRLWLHLLHRLLHRGLSLLHRLCGWSGSCRGRGGWSGRRRWSWGWRGLRQCRCGEKRRGD